MKKVTTEIRERITIPIINWYQTPKGGRGIYYLEGHVHYVHINTPLEQAQSLKLTNKIHSFHTDKKGNVTMYKMTYENDHFVEHECYWNEFTFSPDDIKTLAAHQEFKKACESIGITGQVISLINKIKQRAA